MSLLTNRVIGLCEHCVAGYELPGTPAGTEETIGGKKVYVASSQNVDANTPAQSSAPTSKNAIVVITDIFGLPGGNNQMIADQLAQELSADVYVPDIYDGNAYFQ
jgi:carboxymethylenebutenolidase